MDLATAEKCYFSPLPLLNIGHALYSLVYFLFFVRGARWAGRLSGHSSDSFPQNRPLHRLNVMGINVILISTRTNNWRNFVGSQLMF